MFHILTLQTSTTRWTPDMDPSCLAVYHIKPAFQNRLVGRLTICKIPGPFLWSYMFFSSQITRLIVNFHSPCCLFWSGHIIRKGKCFDQVYQPPKDTLCFHFRLLRQLQQYNVSSSHSNCSRKMQNRNIEIASYQKLCIHWKQAISESQMKIFTKNERSDGIAILIFYWTSKRKSINHRHYPRRLSCDQIWPLFLVWSARWFVPASLSIELRPTGRQFVHDAPY